MVVVEPVEVERGLGPVGGLPRDALRPNGRFRAPVLEPVAGLELGRHSVDHLNELGWVAVAALERPLSSHWWSKL